MPVKSCVLPGIPFWDPGRYPKYEASRVFDITSRNHGLGYVLRVCLLAHLRDDVQVEVSEDPAAQLPLKMTGHKPDKKQIVARGWIHMGGSKIWGVFLWASSKEEPCHLRVCIRAPDIAACR